MSDVMLLDLTSDDGLLVPFRSTTPIYEKESLVKASSERDIASTNAKSPPKRTNSSLGLGRFLSTRRIVSPPPPPPPPPKELQKPEDKLPLKVTTFAFPKARVDHAEWNETDDLVQPAIATTPDRRERDDSTASPTKNNISLRRLEDWDPSENPWYEEEPTKPRSFRIEGYGNQVAPPAEGPSMALPNGLGGLWRSIRGGRSCRPGEEGLKSMRIATEDTKDDKTLLEKVGKAALVVMIPELYAEDEDGEGNLGMYRSISIRDDDDTKNWRQNCYGGDDEKDGKHKDDLDRIGGKNTAKESQEDIVSALRREIQHLRLKQSRLDKALKTSELETNSWKLRCQELEKEIRRLKGQNDDDSSAAEADDTDNDNDDDDEEEEEDDNQVKDNKIIVMESDEPKREKTAMQEEDDGIDENWEGYEGMSNNNKVADLLAWNEEPKVNLSSERELPPGETQECPSEKQDKEPDLMDLTDDKIVFDPYAVNS